MHIGRIMHQIIRNVVQSVVIFAPSGEQRVYLRTDDVTGSVGSRSDEVHVIIELTKVDWSV